MIRNSNGLVKKIFVGLVILGLMVFLFVCFVPRYSVTGQMLRQESALAEAEAKNIQSFIEGIGGGLMLLSSKDEIINPGNGTVNTLKLFVEEWSKNDLIAGVSLTDKDGVVIYNYSDLAASEIGKSVADRDYYIWGKIQPNSEKYLVGESVIARFGVNSGKYITPISVPVFRNGAFSGMLVSAVRTAHLASHYLGEMNITETTDAYIVGLSGHILYSNNDSEKIGINISDSKQKNLFLDNSSLNEKIYHALSKEKDGSLVAKYLDPISGRPEVHAIAYFPVVLPGRHWLVVLATPVADISKASTPTYINQVSMLMFLTLTVFFAVVLYRRVKV